MIKDLWELVIELLKKYRYREYGYNALVVRIDDELRKLAKEFHVAPIDLIGHVLEL